MSDQNREPYPGDAAIGGGFWLTELVPAMPSLSDALCAEVDGEIFYPEKGGSTRDAKQVCRSCTITDACLEWALEHGERFGIWGGMSERERRKIIAQRGITPDRITPDRITTERKAVVYTEDGYSARVAQFNRARVAKHRKKAS